MVRIALPVAIAGLLLLTGGALGASGADTFRLPSGNIFCAYEHYDFAPVDLRCEIRTKVRPLPPRPKACGDGDWGDGYSMRQTGPARVLCISDTIYDPKAMVLAYGSTRQFGVFRCSSSTAGLRCVNSTGNGFFLSKGHSYAYKETAARNGAFKTPSGNIVCGYSIAPSGEGSMECGIKSGLKPPPPRVHCDAGDPTDKRLSLTSTGRAFPVTCAGDPGPFLVEAKARVLAYGRKWSGGGLSCSSATTGAELQEPRRPRLLPQPRALARLLVLDADEVEPPRRRRRAGLRARPALKQLSDLLRALLDHRPDERAHHVPEEAVGGDLELERRRRAGATRQRGSHARRRRAGSRSA